MFPLPLAGLAAAGAALISKYKTGPFPGLVLPRIEMPQKKYRLQVSTPVENPLFSALKSLKYGFAKMMEGPEKIDYDSIIKASIPSGARILKPHYPEGAKTYLVADLDGDSNNEIVTTYRLGAEIKTIILKKLSGSWYNAGEILHPENSVLNFSGVASLSEQSKNQLMVGIAENGKPTRSLYGYSMESDKIRTVFNRSYNKLSIIESKGDTRNLRKHQLAIWEKDGAGSFDVKVLCLKDNELIESDDKKTYYTKNVIPYYVRRIKKSPYNAGNWYDFANMLVKINARKDAQTAINIGSELDTGNKFKEKFENLRNMIL